MRAYQLQQLTEQKIPIRRAACVIPIGSFVANFLESAAKDLIELICLFRNAERRLRRIAGEALICLYCGLQGESLIR
jgi:hypothetical protein